MAPSSGIDTIPAMKRGARATERIVALQRQYSADRRPGGDDDHQRQVADRVDLDHRQLKAPQRRGGATKQLREKERGMPQGLQQSERPTTERGQQLERPHAESPRSCA